MRKIFLCSIVAFATIFVTSCEKDEIQPNKSNDVINQPSENTTKSATLTSTNLIYYCTNIPITRNVSLSPGGFSITIDNMGNRNALLFIYPRTASYVDQGNIIGSFVVNSGLNSSIWKYYQLPSGYSGIQIEIRKDRPTGGYVSGNISIN